MTPPRNTLIKHYYLYGDAVEDVEMDFVHVEPIRDRSGEHDWIIRAHSHPDHVQILLVEQGGGEIVIEARRYSIPRTSLIIVPAAMVHEIRFDPGTDGVVITAASAYLAEVSQGDLRMAALVQEPQVHPLDRGPVSAEATGDAFHWLLREYGWPAPGRRVAIKAHLLRVLVAAMRMRSVETARASTAGDRDYDLLSRYKELLDRDFRAEKAMEHYAGLLGISPQRLNKACKQRAGKTASELLHERVVIEAKRFLVYTELTVAEIGYELGYEDPAYFSRFFSQRVGAPPGAYRASHVRQPA